MEGLRIGATSTGIRFSVRVQPRASANEVVGLYGDALKVRLTAPPVDGAANVGLIALLAGTFGIPARCITLVSGATARTKIVELRGITEERVRQSLKTRRLSRDQT